jgi:hypothetical protein
MYDKDKFSTFYRENKDLLKEYIEIRMDLIRLQGIRMLSRSFSLVMVGLIVILLSLFILFFLGIAFAWWIADLTGSNVVGFVSAAGLFTFLLILTIIFRRPLFQNPMIRLFINESIPENEEEEPDTK